MPIKRIPKRQAYLEFREGRYAPRREPVGKGAAPFDRRVAPEMSLRYRPFLWLIRMTESLCSSTVIVLCHPFLLMRSSIRYFTSEGLSFPRSMVTEISSSERNARRVFSSLPLLARLDRFWIIFSRLFIEGRSQVSCRLYIVDSHLVPYVVLVTFF